MVARRTLMGAALAGAGLVLASCGRGPALGPAVGEAMEDVEGVSGADLESGRDNRFRMSVTGTVSLDATDETTGLAIYDEAMRAAVTLLHDRGEDDVVVGGITGVLSEVTELDALALDPEFPSEDHRLMYVTASSLYGRYGLD
ncbi:hypothetical protein JSY14_09845 [Brachybacterium sp. EF45031]|uniref:hypothetical protein n=1 Tax=Brachybacterium sillae TaxID=2810536 RepID=UPI00217E7D6B|nr:hypothetical protein [Brachybacterium sillae]MCS6712305.1 hypothetical protein [Brachybacterium sillae]